MGGNVPMMWTIIGSMFILCVAGFIGLDRLVSKKANYANKTENIGMDG
jgi:hypothetical protein